MNIARLSEKITIQKADVMIDRIGNHINTFSDLFSCHATVGTESQKETEFQDAGLTNDHTVLTFTVRYNSITRTVDSTHYRIVFRKEIYEIERVDHLNYRNKAIKFHCRKANR